RHLHSFPTRRSSDLSLGAWALYGLGTNNENLPGFVTISPPIQFGAQNYGSAFLPAVYQGTRIGAQKGEAGSSAVGNLRNPDLSRSEEHTSELQSRGH